jgi:hypothetical protein
MRTLSIFFSLFVLYGCADQITATQPQAANQVVHRGVHSGAKARFDYFYSVAVTCEITGYPEVIIVRTPSHGTATIEKRDDYPSFNRDNVRSDCNKKLVGTMQIFYESKPDFHGHDAFTIKVIYPDSNIRTIPYVVEVL